MKPFSLRKLKTLNQFLLCISCVVIVSGLSYLFSDLMGYRVVALILLVTVSLIAIFFDVLPVVSAAIASALIWNYFFIPPKFTLSIKSAEDGLMFIMYFLIALVNAVFTSKIRQMEKIEQIKSERETTLKLYNTLLNSLSHELRTPISTIIGASDNLQALQDKLTEKDKHDLVTEISKASLRLNRQVENLLNMSRLESGFIQPKYDWFDVKELIFDVIHQIDEETNSTKPIHVNVKENLPLFKLDYGLLTQILHNLIHNAVTYIPKYAVITVKAFCKENKLVIVIEDTGNGFPIGEIDKVFDKFYRLKNSGAGGTGLGLSIVKGFVEAMNGSISLQNMADGGAIFSIEIPSELSYLKG